MISAVIKWGCVVNTTEISCAVSTNISPKGQENIFSVVKPSIYLSLKRMDEVEKKERNTV